MVPNNLEGPRARSAERLAAGGETNEWANTSTLV
ncbi:Mu-like prophage major head subunit gpT family protein [Marinobacter subterrani]|nr:Mu-like prophage major head subunit gpT family protein [Marinobacter subterrani]